MEWIITAFLTGLLLGAGAGVVGERYLLPARINNTSTYIYNTQTQQTEVFQGQCTIVVSDARGITNININIRGLTNITITNATVSNVSKTNL